jgi:hypothetical protein
MTHSSRASNSSADRLIWELYLPGEAIPHGCFLKGLPLGGQSEGEAYPLKNQAVHGSPKKFPAAGFYLMGSSYEKGRPADHGGHIGHPVPPRFVVAITEASNLSVAVRHPQGGTFPEGRSRAELAQLFRNLPVILRRGDSGYAAVTGGENRWRRIRCPDTAWSLEAGVPLSPRQEAVLLLPTHNRMPIRSHSRLRLKRRSDGLR